LCLNRGPCMFCGCIISLISLTSPPWVPYFMCLLLLSAGRLGPSRARVGVGFRCVRLVQGWFRRFRLPPLRWSCSVSVGLRFSFSLALSGFARFGPGFIVLVLSPSLFFCVPLFASWLSNFHLILIFTSSSFPFFFIFISPPGP